jgi:NADPH:quinone reductase
VIASGFLDSRSYRGCVVVFSSTAASGERGASFPTALMKRCQAVVGFYLPQIMTRPEILTPSLQEILGCISTGVLELTIGARYPLEKAAETHEGRKTTGKIILNP